MTALVDQNTLIDYGMSLSKSFALEHMTSGAFNNIIGRITPTFPSKLIPWQQNGLFSSALPIWQIVRNLQIGSLNVADGMASAMGGDMILMAGYQNNAPTTANTIAETNHTTGTSIDIAINNYTDNPYQAVPELVKLCTNVQRVSVIYAQDIGWLHLDLNINPQGNIIVPNEGPTLQSINLVTGERGNGNIPYFGWY